MDKLRIAICDDDQKELDSLKALIREYDESKQYELICLNRAVDLLKQKTAFDIVLLDIEMEAPNGYEVGKQLVQEEDHAIIIFVTKSPEYSTRGYGVALRYLIKPVNRAELYEALDSAISEATSRRTSFVIDGTTYSLRTHEVYYIEAFGHTIVIHTSNQDYQIRGTLKELFSMLPHGQFAIPHQSYIVNMEHIKTASCDQIGMTNGAKIPISRRRQAEFNRQFYAYLGR